MISTTFHQVDALRLIPFQTRFAYTVSRWVTTRQELRLLAPSSTFPLLVSQVACWVKPGGRAFLLIDANESHLSTTSSQFAISSLGYGELNPMRGHADHLWIGHLVVDPRRRGMGYGMALTNLLVDEAFARYGAARISLVVFPENVAAVRCYENAGFIMVREERHRFGEHGLHHRLLRFEMQRSDYLTRFAVVSHYPSDVTAK